MGFIKKIPVPIWIVIIILSIVSMTIAKQIISGETFNSGNYNTSRGENYNSSSNSHCYTEIRSAFLNYINCIEDIDPRNSERVRYSLKGMCEKVMTSYTYSAQNVCGSSYHNEMSRVLDSGIGERMKNAHIKAGVWG